MPLPVRFRGRISARIKHLLTTGLPAPDLFVSGRLVPVTALTLAQAMALGLTACATTPSSAPVPEVPASISVEKTALVAESTGVSSATLEQWFTDARDVVSRQLEVDLSGVTATIVNARQIATQARSSLLGALSHDISNNDFAESLVDNILDAQTASVLAIYSPEKHSILLHKTNLIEYLQAQDNWIEPKASVQALLIHELVHAADDIQHNAFSRNDVSYQEVFAKSTIVEGHAQWQTRRLCKVSGCTAAFNSLNQYMFDVETPDDPALQYVQTRNFKNLEFVYREGERFIDQLMHRPNGKSLVALAFAEPPRDSIQIIDPDSFPNRARESRNLALSAAIVNSGKPWSKREKGTLRRNVLAAAAFSVNPDARAPIVDFYTSKILAAAKHEYYDRSSDTPIPVAVIALQTDNVATARKTAALIFDTTARTYSGLGGELVTIENWTTGRHYAQIPNTAPPATQPRPHEAGQPANAIDIEMYTASGDMINGMVNDNYPVEVVTATSGQYIVHIDGRHQGSEELMQFAGQLLLTLQSDEATGTVLPSSLNLSGTEY